MQNKFSFKILQTYYSVCDTRTFQSLRLCFLIPSVRLVHRFQQTKSKRCSSLKRGFFDAKSLHLSETMAADKHARWRVVTFLFASSSRHQPEGCSTSSVNYKVLPLQNWLPSERQHLPQQHIRSAHLLMTFISNDLYYSLFRDVQDILTIPTSLRCNVEP